MILLIDNYDSFSYNVFQLVGSVNPDIRVIRNDECSVDEIRAMNPSHIILSPGPGRPDKAGVCENVIRELGGRIPILGICLGHQAIGEYFGAEVRQLSRPKHGHASPLRILEPDDALYHGVEDGTIVGRYHSWVLDRDTFPSSLHPTAVDEDGNIMSFTHRTLPVFGVQYHPESVITVQGQAIVRNWLSV